MTLRIVTLAAAQLFDLLTFVRLVELRGIGAEGNPFIREAVESYGLPPVVLLKVALALLLVSAFVVLYQGVSGQGSRRRYPELAGVIVIAAVVFGFLGGLSNVASL